MLWSIIVISVGVYIGLVALLVLFQSSFLYFPSGNIEATPKDIGLPFEEVWLRTSDRVKLHSWFVPAEKNRGVVLFFHGNGGNISHRLDSIYTFNRLGLSVFIFDYRGYGQSEGKTTEEGTYRDAEAAWFYLVEKRKIPPGEIVIFGRSLGGSIASWLAQDHIPRALIVESSFTSVPDIGAEIYPFFPVKQISRFEYNTREYLSRVNCPVLIVHSPEDDLIPFSHGEKLFESAKDPKNFLEIRGGHNDGFMVSGGTYKDGLESFFSVLRERG